MTYETTPYLDNFSNESCLYFDGITFEWKFPSLHMDSADADGDGECETELEEQYSEKLIFGDLNIDGIVSIKDMVYILKYLSKIIKLSDVQMKNADCLHDGEVNLADASVLLNFVSEKTDKIPIEKSN